MPTYLTITPQSTIDQWPLHEHDIRDALGLADRLDVAALEAGCAIASQYRREGVSLVPHRVLARYGDRRRVGRLRLRPQFMRELAVVVRKNRIHPEPLASFIEGVLF